MRYSPWGHKRSETTEQLSLSLSKVSLRYNSYILKFIHLLNTIPWFLVFTELCSYHPNQFQSIFLSPPKRYSMPFGSHLLSFPALDSQQSTLQG